MEETSRRITSKSEKILQVIAHVVLIFLSLCSIVPFLLLVVSSFTPEQELLSSGYTFLPKAFSLEAYEYLLESNGNNIFRSYFITICMTAIGTGLSLLITPMLAYVYPEKTTAAEVSSHFCVFYNAV